MKRRVEGQEKRRMGVRDPFVFFVCVRIRSPRGSGVFDSRKYVYGRNVYETLHKGKVGSFRPPE